MSIIQGTSKSSAATYEIDQSIRFNDDDSAFLSRTPGSTSNRKTYTVSFWFKIGKVGGEPAFFVAGDYPGGASGSFTGMLLQNAVAASPLLTFSEYPGGASYTWQVQTNAIFRDPSAWYHFVGAVDTTQSTASDRVKLYVNGELQTDLRVSSYPSLNHDTLINDSSNTHRIGRYGTTSFYADGYMAEFNFIDGTALDPTSFGETNADTGQWTPVKYAGSYGSNGFYLKGQDSSALGDDSSGNGADYATTNLAAADQVTDSPTSNHCTLNPLWVDGYTLSDGNLVTNQSGDAAAIGTMAFDPTDSDGFYFEAKVTTAATYPNVGIRTIESCSKVGAVSNLSGNSTGRYSYTGSNGQFNDAGSGSSYGDAWSGTADKVIGVLVKAGSLYFSVDGTIQNSGTAAKTGLTGLMVPTVFYDAGSGTQAAWEMRFDAADWSTTPSGYKALSTAALPEPSIPDPSAYFQTSLWNGNGSTQTITQSGNSTFEPGMIWSKARNAAQEHVIFDQVRGTTKYIQTDNSGAEGTQSGVTAFNSDGFDLGSWAVANGSGQTHVGWQWKADGTSGSSNTDGATSSTVSASSTSGFSIVKWTGTGSATTLGHGLGSVPKMIWVKNLADADSWVVYHESMGATKGLALDTNALPTTASTFFNNTAPTSSVFTVGSGGRTNGSSDGMLAYCFAEVEGFSKIGSYTGNGSTDGTFIYTGFKPAWVMLKRYDSGGEWEVSDRVRDPDNPVRLILQPNSSAAEWDATTRDIDWLSNGFKHRSAHADFNASSGSYLFAAFAESPFKTATAR